MVSNLEANRTLLSGLGRIDILTINPKERDPQNYAYGICGSVEIYIENQIDHAGIELEKERII